MEYSHLHFGQPQEAASAALSAGMERRTAARAAAASRDWRAQDWMQRRWKTEKQREEQDQVGSEGRMRSRQMRHDTAPEEEEARKDWIFERSTVAAVWPVNWR